MRKPLVDELAALHERLRTSTPFWSENCATILDEQRRPVRLKARPWQLTFDAAMERQRRSGQPVRVQILKARKLGFSTWVQAKFMQRVSLFPYEHALTIAQNRKTVGVLFDMAKLIYGRLPTDAELAQLIFGDGARPVPFSVRPQWLGGSETRADNKWMVLGDRGRKEEQSVYETLTAGSGSGGRGYTPSMVHCSEVAHWEDPNFKIGLLNSVPMTPNTIVVLESTANGFNDFYEMWTRAVEGAEDPETGGLYVPLFFGWQDNPANRREFTTDAARERFERTVGDTDGEGDEEEVELIERFGVSLEQLFWRRTVLHGPEISSKIDFFHQEHPATPEQAFIGSGQPVFSGILVARAIKAADSAPAPVEGVLRGVEWRERRTRAGTVRVPQRAVWVPSAEPVDSEVWAGSRLRVWEHPVNAETEKVKAVEKRRPDGQYVVFADVAVGKGSTEVEGDFHAVQVLDHVSREQVAVYRSRIPVHDLPLVLVLIALYFNEAWLAPEVNGPGQGVIDVLRADYRYPRLYRRGRAGDDERQDRREHMLGWLTDLRTKPLMEQTFGQALKEGTHGLRDVPTAREFSTYVEDPKNPAKHGAQPGAHDDLAMAFMGAHRVAAELKPRDRSRRSARDRTVIDEITGYGNW